MGFESSSWRLAGCPGLPTLRRAPDAPDTLSAALSSKAETRRRRIVEALGAHGPPSNSRMPGTRPLQLSSLALNFPASRAFLSFHMTMCLIMAIPSSLSSGSERRSAQTPTTAMTRPARPWTPQPRPTSSALRPRDAENERGRGHRRSGSISPTSRVVGLGAVIRRPPRARCCACRIAAFHHIRARRRSWATRS